MKRSPITGRTGSNKSQRKENLIWEKAFFIPLPLLKYIIHPFRYWGCRKGLHILIMLLSIFITWRSFRTSGLSSCCNTLCPSWSSFPSLLSALCNGQWERGFLLSPLSICLLWLNSFCYWQACCQQGVLTLLIVSDPALLGTGLHTRTAYSDLHRESQSRST